jgi:ankyrin repeat protein
VKRDYAGVDVLIQHKQENNFYELEYPFRICLYQPYRPADPSTIQCIPLPAEVRARGSRNTILHEFATHGLTKYFNELIRIAKKDADLLRDTCLYIANKINGRNEKGQTPLILAIQSLRYEFVEILLDNKADVNMIDSQGCSPLHYACRQANVRILKKLIDRQADPHYINPR